MSRTIWLLLALSAAVPARAQTMTASWYGPRFHGRPTASGCIYDMYGLTAASRDLPLGSLVAVSRAGRRVVLQINDRGPYIAHRQLDLSRGAAERLDMLGIGVAKVEVERVGFQPLHCSR